MSNQTSTTYFLITTSSQASHTSTEVADMTSAVRGFLAQQRDMWRHWGRTFFVG